MKKANPLIWDKTWNQNIESTIPSKMDLIIFKEITKAINYQNKETIELGCGKGILSYLISKKARKVTLVDFSKEALRLAKNLFGNEQAEFIETDIFELSEKKKYDIVFSSGVAEHFSDKLRKDIIKKHLSLSRDKVIIIVPARPHFNTIRQKKRRTINLYGWQQAFSKNEIQMLIEENQEFKIISNKRFYTLYGINIFEIFSIDKINIIINYWNFCCNALDKVLTLLKVYDFFNMFLKLFDNKLGGLLIIVAEKQ